MSDGGSDEEEFLPESPIERADLFGDDDESMPAVSRSGSTARVDEEDDEDMPRARGRKRVPVDDEEDLPRAGRKRPRAALDSDDEEAEQQRQAAVAAEPEEEEETPEEREARIAEEEAKAEKKRLKEIAKEEKLARRAARKRKFAGRGGDDDEDEEEDDIDRLAKSKFLDLEAGESDAEDEEGIDEDMADFLADEGDEADAAEASLAGRSRSRGPSLPPPGDDERPHPRAHRQGGAQRLFAGLDELERKYQEQAQADEEAGVEEDVMGSEDEDEEEEARRSESQQKGPMGKLLPDVRDPKLWMVKCMQNGKESELVMGMVTKSREMVRKGEKIVVFSAFANPNLRGYVYIEAFKEAEVVEFVRTFRPLAGWSVALVPMTEMDKVFDSAMRQAKEKDVHLKSGQWARLKQGVNKGDLVKVRATGADRVEVQMIPRSYNDGTKHKIGAAVKAPRRFMHEGMHVREGEKLRDGYVEKSVPAHHLVLAKPDLKEMTTFFKGDVPREEIEQSGLSMDVPFFVDDMVIVASGDMKNMVGKIKKVTKGDNDIRISLQPMVWDGRGDKMSIRCYKVDESLAALQHLDFSPDQLNKWFEAGNHVMCRVGSMSGETGMVCKIEQKESSRTAIVLSDTTMQEFKVPVNALVHATEKATIKKVHGEYNVGDLVQLATQNNLACVVAVEFDKNLRVLTKEGRAQVVHMAQIGSKKTTRAGTSAQVTGENTNQMVQAKSMVKVTAGPWKGRSGEVKHIWNKFIWVKIFDKTEDAGFVCVLTNQLKVAMQHKRALEIGMGSDGRLDLKSDRAVKSFKKRQGTTVQINRGPYKGIQGTIRQETETHVKVALSTKPKVVNLSKEWVSYPSEHAPGQDVQDLMDAPIVPPSVHKYGKTPAAFYTPHTARTGDEGLTNPWQADATPMPMASADAEPSQSSQTENRNPKRSMNYPAGLKLGQTPVDLEKFDLTDLPSADIGSDFHMPPSTREGRRRNRTAPTDLSPHSDMDSALHADSKTYYSNTMNSGMLTPDSPTASGLSNKGGLTPEDDGGLSDAELGSFDVGAGGLTGTPSDNDLGGGLTPMDEEDILNPPTDLDAIGSDGEAPEAGWESPGEDASNSQNPSRQASRQTSRQGSREPSQDASRSASAGGVAIPSWVAPRKWVVIQSGAYAGRRAEIASVADSGKMSVRVDGKGRAFAVNLGNVTRAD